jgi:hypothetical protein
VVQREIPICYQLHISFGKFAVAAGMSQETRESVSIFYLTLRPGGLSRDPRPDISPHRQGELFRAGRKITDRIVGLGS